MRVIPGSPNTASWGTVTLYIQGIPMSMVSSFNTDYQTGYANSNGYQTLSGPVPPGASYYLTYGSDARLYAWHEMR